MGPWQDTFKCLIWIKLFRYWMLNVKHFTPRNIAYILLAEYGMEETYFGCPSLRCVQCKMFNLVSTKIFLLNDAVHC